MFLGSVGACASSPQMVVTFKADPDNIATGILSICLEAARYRLTTMYISLSLSLNVLLTFMIVVRLVLRGRRIRAAMGSPAGISRLYKSIATMLVESSALFAVNSLLVIGTWAAKHPVANVFTRTLAETQVRAFHNSDLGQVVSYGDGMGRSSLRCSSSNESQTRAR